MSYYCCGLTQGVFTTRAGSGAKLIAVFPSGKKLYVPARELTSGKVKLKGDIKYPVEVPEVKRHDSLVSPSMETLQYYGKGIPSGLMETTLSLITEYDARGNPTGNYKFTDPLGRDNYGGVQAPVGPCLHTTVISPKGLALRKGEQEFKEKFLQEQGWLHACSLRREAAHDQRIPIKVWLGEVK